MADRVTLSGKPAASVVHDDCRANPEIAAACPECSGAKAPQPIDPKTGMHDDYWVLSAAERSKGFVRPVREAYVHAKGHAS